MLVASLKRERDGIHVADRRVVALSAGSSSSTTQSATRHHGSRPSAWSSSARRGCPDGFAPGRRLPLGDLSAGNRDPSGLWSCARTSTTTSTIGGRRRGFPTLRARVADAALASQPFEVSASRQPRSACPSMSRARCAPQFGHSVRSTASWGRRTRDWRSLPRPAGRIAGKAVP